MLQNPAPELSTDCLECKNLVKKDSNANLVGKIKPDLKNIDIANYCEENVKDGMAQGFWNLDEKEVQQKINAKNYDFIHANTDLFSSWNGSMYPSYDVRLQSYKRSISSKTVDFMSEEDTAAKFQSFMKMDIDHEKDLKKEDLAKSILCAQYGPLNIKYCTSALNSIVELMNPAGGLTLISLLQNMLKDDDYNKASTLIASKIDSKISKGQTAVGDWYSDVYESFLSLGLKPEEAEEKSYNLIGIISSRGPNIFKLWPFFTSKNAQFYNSMVAISTGIGVLNSVSSKDGHLYSYPPNVKGYCDNGKPYHFWMSAFLARKMTQKTGNRKAAISATYLTQLAYQMKSGSYGRDPARSFTVDTFSSANNKIRLDLAYASAGAVYGASVAEKKNLKKNINVDEGMKKLLENADAKEILSQKEAENMWQGFGVKAYLRWRDIFSPDSSLDLYKKSLK